jgi:hypothetical protein
MKYSDQKKNQLFKTNQLLANTAADCVNDCKLKGKRKYFVAYPIATDESRELQILCSSFCF